MNSQQRFQLTMQSGEPDRVPLFQEGIRQQVIDVWHSQGMPVNENLEDLFKYDSRQELQLDLELGWNLQQLAGQDYEHQEFRERYQTDRAKRLPEALRNGSGRAVSSKTTSMLKVHDGFFLSLEVGEWATFYPAVLLACDRPDFVCKHLEYLGELSASLLETAAGVQRFDALVFSEPISSSHGPLISPQMYREMVLPGYAPVIQKARDLNIETIIIRTYAR